MEPNDDKIRQLAGNPNPEDNFKVPGGYFDTFSSRLKERIEARKPVQRQPVWKWLLRPALTLPVAAMVIGVVAYFAFFNTPSTIQPAGSSKMVAAAPDTVVSDSTIIEYLADEMEVEELEDIVLAYAEEETVAVPASANSEPVLNEKEIEEYLINNADEALLENL